MWSHTCSVRENGEGGGWRRTKTSELPTAQKEHRGINYDKAVNENITEVDWTLKDGTVISQ